MGERAEVLPELLDAYRVRLALAARLAAYTESAPALRRVRGDGRPVPR